MPRKPAKSAALLEVPRPKVEHLEPAAGAQSAAVHPCHLHPLHPRRPHHAGQLVELVDLRRREERLVELDPRALADDRATGGQVERRIVGQPRRLDPRSTPPAPGTTSDRPGLPESPSGCIAREPTPKLRFSIPVILTILRLLPLKMMIIWEHFEMFLA